MRTRPVLVLLAILAGVTGAYAYSNRYIQNAQAVTDVNTTLVFTDNGSGGTAASFKARSILLCNDDVTNALYYDEVDGVATTADSKLAAGECRTLSYNNDGSGFDAGWDSLGVICGAALTATARVEAVR